MVNGIKAKVGESQSHIRFVADLTVMTRDFKKRNSIGVGLINIGAVLSNDVVVLSNVDAVLTLGRTLLVFSLYFQTFRMVLTRNWYCHIRA